MGVTFQSVDAVLNLTWALVSVAALLLSWRSGRAREHKQALIATLFLLVLLFPVISTADDTFEQALMYELAPSPLCLKSAKEIKQSIAPHAVVAQAVRTPAAPPVGSVAEDVHTASTVSFTLFLNAASGIHSPPQS